MEKTIGDIAQRLTDEEADERDLQVFEQTLGLGLGQETSSFEGQFAVVNDRDLAYHTQHGSRLVRVLDRTMLHEQWVEKERDHPHGTNYGRQHYREKEMQWGPGQVFLIFTPAPAAALLKRLNDAVERANEAERQGSEANDKRVREVQELTKKILALESRERSNQSGLAEATARVLAAEERTRKMEADIAKVRTEIGEAAWKKIVA